MDIFQSETGIKEEKMADKEPCIDCPDKEVDYYG